MTPHIPKVTVGTALYLALVLSLYGLSVVAFPNGAGPIPLWFSSAQVFARSHCFCSAWVSGWLAGS